MFSNGESYYKTEGLSYYWSRGLKDYREEHRVPVDDIIKRLSAGKSNLQILDLGSMTSQMLSEVKDIFKDTIVTHGLSPLHCPQYKVDHFHCLYGEYLPKSFANKFDLIVSQRAIEYAMFPDLILENIVQSLAPGGEAYLQWQPGRFILNHHYPELVQQYLDCVNAKMRSVKENHTEVKVEPNANSVEILCGKLLWFHKVEELQGRRGLTVLDYQDRPLKICPYYIKIRKNE
jgi:SAM-dependent methyltransferase